MADESREDSDTVRSVGWHPDENDLDTMRWWDGKAWTTSRPRLPADAQVEQARSQAAPTAPTAPATTAATPSPGEEQQTDGAPVAPPVTTPAPTKRTRKPWWHYLRIIAVVVVVLIGGITWATRHFSGLDSSRSGTQQQWVDYFDHSRSAVSTFDTMSATTSAEDIGKAFDTLATSPDDTLNKEARTAKKECAPTPKPDCQTSVTTLVNDYNQAIEEAHKKGLIKIDKGN